MKVFFRIARAILAVSLMAGLWSCAPAVPYRKASSEGDLSCRGVMKRNDELTSNGSIHDSLKESTCWYRKLEEHPDYDLLTVEFDDQGWLEGTSKGQPKTDRISELLKSLETIYNENQSNGISVVVYVHGWKHNAHPEDTDVSNLRRFLAEVKVAEEGRTLSPKASDSDAAPRVYSVPQDKAGGPRVVGIYVGWRGASLPIPWLENITFWDRKATAEQVASGSVRELFEQLDLTHACGRTKLNWKETRKRVSPEEALKETVGARNVRMLVIGHSFGGLVVHRATSGKLIGSAVRGSKDEFLTRIGDLVVVVNPAFEGARYEPLHMAGRRIESVKDNQLPLLIVATSQADLATKYAFPIARGIWTVFESQPDDEYDAAVKAVGHNPRYLTHTLSKCKASDPGCKAKASCTPDPERAKKAQTEAQRAILGEATLMEAFADSGFKDKTTYLCGELELTVSENRTPKDNPYWVVSTTGEIMDGHNDIFNENFKAFFRQMYVSVMLARSKNRQTNRCVGER